MARPIPINQAGLQHRGRFHAQAYTPRWGIPQQSAAPPPRAVAQESWMPTGMLLLGVSSVMAGLAVISSLEIWPALAASNMGLDERDTFFLLASGVYLLATSLYAGWRTRLLQELSQAPWDARLMAYADLAVGAVVSSALGVVALAIVAVILLLAGLAALLLSGTGDQPRG